MILAAVPIWMAEVVPPYLRGALVQIHAIVLVLGYNLASWLGFGIYHWENGGNATWRIPFAVQCFWPLCLVIGLWWVPESREYTNSRAQNCSERLTSNVQPAGSSGRVAMKKRRRFSFASTMILPILRTLSPAPSSSKWKDKSLSIALCPRAGCM